MEIYILRHGLAGNASDWIPRRDSLRPLTKEGVQKTKRIAKALKSLGLSFDVILTSPYTRARHTAEIVAKTLHQTKTLQIESALAVGGNLQAIPPRLKAHSKTWKSVLLVGHEPSLGQLISEWVSGSPDGMTITLKKGGLCKLTATSIQSGRCATLDWLVPPKVLLR